MIYITGDTHGGFQRFGNKYFPPQKQISEGCGTEAQKTGIGWTGCPANPSPPCLWMETTRISTY